MRNCVLKFFILLGIVFTLLSLTFGQDEPNLPLNKCWEFPNDNLTNLHYASDNLAEMYLPLNNGSIVALNKSGQIIWNTEIGGEILSSLIYVDKKIYFITNKSIENEKIDLTLYSISSETGITQWQTQLTNNNNSLLISLLNDLIIIDKDKGFSIFDKDSGSLKKQVITEKILASNITKKSDALLIFSNLNGLQQFSIADEQMKNLGYMNQKINHIFSTKDKGVLLSTESGQLIFINPESGKKKWSNRIGASISNIFETDDSLLISSVDNYIYRLSLKNGKVIWRRRFETRTLSNFLTQTQISVSSFINGQTTAFTEYKKGRIINQISINSPDFYVNKPLIIGDKVVLFQNKSVVGYQFGSCAK